MIYRQWHLSIRSNMNFEWSLINAKSLIGADKSIKQTVGFTVYSVRIFTPGGISGEISGNKATVIKCHYWFSLE